MKCFCLLFSSPLLKIHNIELSTITEILKFNLQSPTKQVYLFDFEESTHKFLQTIQLIEYPNQFYA